MLMGHGLYGVLRDDVIIPTKRGVFHLHGLPGWVMALAMFCGAVVLIAAVIDHYDRRDNEGAYKRFGKLTARAGWLLTGVAMGLQVAGVGFPGPSNVTSFSALVGLMVLVIVAVIGLANERAVERTRIEPIPLPAAAPTQYRLGRALSGLLMMFLGLLVFLAVLPGILRFNFVEFALASISVMIVAGGWMLYATRISEHKEKPEPKRRSRLWAAARVGVLLVIGLWLIWYAKTSKQGEWLPEDEAQRQAAPPWKYTFDDFATGIPRAALQKQLSAEGFRMKCYSNLAPQERIMPDDIEICWTIANNTAGIPSRMIAFFFGKDGLNHIRADFAKEDWPRVRDWIETQGDMGAGTFGRDQGGGRIIGRRGKTGIILTSEPGFLGWSMVQWHGREHFMASGCHVEGVDDPKWKTLCDNWPESPKPPPFMARIAPPAPKVEVPATLATTLEGVYRDFAHCRFDKFFWDAKSPHPYFFERGLQPYDTQNGIARFKLHDVLFGMQVRELIVPVTWAYHGVLLDEPLAQARQQMKQRFNSEFRPSGQSKQGIVPELIATADGKHSALICHEGEPGLPN